ncbi:hypothetical protein LCGC14_2650310, partial [marine sediment metagenome]
LTPTPTIERIVNEANPKKNIFIGILPDIIEITKKKIATIINENMLPNIIVASPLVRFAETSGKANNKQDNLSILNLNIFFILQ